MPTLPKPTNLRNAPQLPPLQVWDKCDEELRWERSDPLVKSSPLVARVSKPSEEWDCDDGIVAPPLNF
jgi:hypothetical protein